MENLEDIFSNLNLNSDEGDEDADKYLKEIDIALKKNETTSRWIDELQKVFGSVVQQKLLETTKIVDDPSNASEHDAGSLRYAAIELIAKRCIRIENKIQRDEFQEADAIDLVKFINEHKPYYAEKEYVVGFRYVANCLAIKGRLREIRKKNEVKKINIARLKDLLRSLNEYQNFDIYHQVGVLAIKQYFAGNLLKNISHDFQLGVIRDLSKMDPENLEWHFCLYSVLRFKRAANKTRVPSQEEINVIVHAIDKRYAIFDARICLGYAFCLAELLKNSENTFAPIRYGRKIFVSEAEVLKCIRAKVNNVLAIDPTSVRSNVDVAKIYSSVLPYKYRDTEFSMVCIERALLFHPNSSKANHRMAVLLISKNSPNAALEYLQKAVECDNGNIFATFDLLGVCMTDIPKHKNEMEQILENPSIGMRNYFGEILLVKALLKLWNVCVYTAQTALSVNWYETHSVEKVYIEHSSVASV